MKITVIEDCSPYYIRFTHDGIEDVIEKCLTHIEGKFFFIKFTHHRYEDDQAKDILSSIPFNKDLNLNQDRVALFVTQPGYYYRAHKDGLCHHYSINYTVKILDDKCITSWYSDEDLKKYAIDNLPNRTSRECIGFDKTKHTPLKSMTAVQGEAILFNTEIFHDFDNSKSSNIRMVMTLRDADPGNVYFDDIKNKLFGGLAQLGEQ